MILHSWWQYQLVHHIMLRTHDCLISFILTIKLEKVFFQWFRFTIKNSLLSNFFCFSLLAFILFILMFITCIMIRIFYKQTNKLTNQKNHTNNVATTNKINIKITKNILPIDAGVMVVYHRQKNNSPSTSFRGIIFSSSNTLL